MISDDIRIDSLGIGEAARRAAEVLGEGGLLVHPTGTVYGLGGAPDAAVEADINRLKGREPQRPFIRLAASTEDVRRLLPSADWPEAATRLAAVFWPGPLTLVLDDGSETGVAVRVAEHGVLRRVLATLDALLLSTSLNPSGGRPTGPEERARRTAEVLPDVGRRIAFVAAGDLPGPPPSTLVSVRERDGGGKILRAGAVSADRVLECLGEGSSCR
ncbi:MAG: L-threonylcarbamoyladenylate synthase [Gemmatimonadota bacterium]